MADRLKIIEVLAESDKSWEDAAQTRLRVPGKLLRASSPIKELEAKVENNKIVRYRINAKISFMLG